METMRSIHSQRLHTVTQDENAATAFRAGKQFQGGERAVLGGGGVGNGMKKGSLVGGTRSPDGGSKPAAALSCYSDSREGKKAVGSEAGRRRALGDITNTKKVLLAVGKSSLASGGGDLKSSAAKGDKGGRFSSGQEVKPPPQVKRTLPSSNVSGRKGHLLPPLEPESRAEFRGKVGGARSLGQTKGEAESFISRTLRSIDERAEKYADEGIEHCFMTSSKVAGLVEEMKKKDLEETIKPLLDFRTDYFPHFISRSSSDRLAYSLSPKRRGCNLVPQSPPPKSPSASLPSWERLDLEEMGDGEVGGRVRPMFLDGDDSVLPDIPVEPIFGHGDFLSFTSCFPVFG
ncbi:hypothetical protein CBR_g30220 [Chara braunii]|uniref:Uncharacterized protein n=1 Tax=Chara braunii TaxID=69332 RepID=A0A388LCD5_CHABU|nr:hypothetical protein CBR_g30220 [Chara braunii]|eukprot:GBG79958.1 hypothetical protein CBR_g30220 [Chara braunii]